MSNLILPLRFRCLWWWCWPSDQTSANERSRTSEEKGSVLGEVVVEFPTANLICTEMKLNSMAFVCEGVLIAFYVSRAPSQTSFICHPFTGTMGHANVWTIEKRTLVS